MYDFDDPEWALRIEAANNVSLVDYCERFGFPLEPWGNEWRHKEWDSLKIRGNEWKRWSGKTGKLGKYDKGTSIFFVMEYEGMTYFEALEKLLAFARPDLLPLPYHIKKQENSQPKKYTSVEQLIKRAQGGGDRAEQGVALAELAALEKDKPFVLPNKSINNERAYAYLTKTRKIDAEIVKELFSLGTLYEDVRHNCVFVGYDDNGNPAYAYKRGTYTNTNKPFKGDHEGSNKAYCWSYAPDKTSKIVMVYESPIEAVSHITVNKERGDDWQKAHYLSLSCTGDPALVGYLRRNPQIEQIVFCMNNDAAGRKATRTMLKRFGVMYSCSEAPPPEDFNDWNDYVTGRFQDENQREE